MIGEGVKQTDLEFCDFVKRASSFQKNYMGYSIFVMLQMARAIWWFFFSKIIEILDTVSRQCFCLSCALNCVRETVPQWLSIN